MIIDLKLLYKKNNGKIIVKKYYNQLIKMHHIVKYSLKIMIWFHYSNSTLANHKKNIKNVNCKEKRIYKDFLNSSAKEVLNFDQVLKRIINEKL